MNYAVVKIAQVMQQIGKTMKRRDMDDRQTEVPLRTLEASHF